MEGTKRRKEIKGRRRKRGGRKEKRCSERGGWRGWREEWEMKGGRDERSKEERNEKGGRKKRLE